ncbi:RNA polymerase Rpc34 [Carpediemonas membranifera]|uniref:RNA polymerase Rpc34 n=1 Tax=Carpediemonas membranifera TaxID=201153 RepID=A0A8J6ASX9_9EUKA|nr:RNA polymerase Rpc34 [Carpediemonas membranifera]|eukprot:KAG9393283.1 RNA polymerase Rpc34 [Carpediemonas membranifera]
MAPKIVLLPEEKMVLEIILQGGSNGKRKTETLREMRRRTKEVTKSSLENVLDKLKNEKLIKEVTAQTARNDKVLMGFDFKPSKELTGSAWYSDGVLDLDFVHQLFDIVAEYLSSASRYCTEKTILDVLQQSGVLPADIRDNVGDEEVAQLMNAMRLDGVVTVKEQDEGRFYSLVVDAQQHGGRELASLLETPCYHCPVRMRCSMLQVEDVCPQRCEYFNGLLAGANR